MDCLVYNKDGILMNVDVPKCSNCTYCTLNKSKRDGICRRYPPVYVGNGDGWDFPLVNALNVCGEHPSMRMKHGK